MDVINALLQTPRGIGILIGSIVQIVSVLGIVGIFFQARRVADALEHMSGAPFDDSDKPAFTFDKKE